MLTQQQIAELVRIIKLHADYFLVTLFGRETVTKQQIESLKTAGLIPPTTDPKIFENAFVLGKLKAMITADEYKDLGFKELTGLAKRMWVEMEPLSAFEKIKVESSRLRAARGVQNLSNEIAAGLYTSLEKRLGEPLTERKAKDIIKQTVISAQEKRKSKESLVADLRENMQDYTRDWLRVASTELHQSRQWGIVDSLLNKEGVFDGWKDADDPLVFVKPTTGACDECLRDYLDDSGIPIIWLLSKLLANGTNIGVPKKKRKAVVPPHHPWSSDLLTEALTLKDGWKYIKDIKLGELLLSVDLETGNAEWTKVIRLIRYRYTGLMDYFHNTRIDIMTTPDHRHPVKFRKKQKGRNDAGYWKLVSGKDLPKHDFNFLAAIPNWEGKSSKTVKLCGREFDTALFMEFMAYYLSDGCLGSSDWLFIGQKDRYDLMLECAVKIFQFGVSQWKDGIGIKVNSEIYAWFKKLGKCDKKYIPRKLKGLSKEYLRIFLDAYLNADGHERPSREFGNTGYISKPERTYYTTSPQLAADIGELILKCGNRSSYFEELPKTAQFPNGVYTGNYPIWHIRECRQSELGIRSITREAVEYDDDVVCIELEKFHTFFMRRNGKVVLTGNCLCELTRMPPGHEFDEKGNLKAVNMEEFYRKILRGEKV
jgi:hypothetical protein